MKQSVFFTLVLLLCAAMASGTAAAAVDSEQALEARGKHHHASHHHHVSSARGKLGQKCKTNHKCNSGLLCFSNKCYGKTQRPKLAPCRYDTNCATGYCGSQRRCALQRANGKTCSRDAQCSSLKCDAASKTCVTNTVSTTVPAGATQAQITQAAANALAQTSAVPNSAAYSSTAAGQRALLAQQGTVKTTGDVQVVSTSAGPAIQAAADATHPAVVQQVLSQPLRKRDTYSYAYTFHYLTTAFTTTDASQGACSIVPSINGVELTPIIAIKANGAEGTGSFTYQSSSVTSYALALLCDSASSATVQYDSVVIKRVAASTTTATTSSTSTTSSSTSTTTTTTTTSNPTPTPTIMAIRRNFMQRAQPHGVRRARIA